jgi:hypothetical protein
LPAAQNASASAVVLSPDVGTEEETFEIHGQGYAIQIDSVRCAVRIVEGGREVLSWRPDRDAFYEFLCGALGETERFVAALRDGRGFAPDLREALVSMRASEAIEAGGKVTLEKDH